MFHTEIQIKGGLDPKWSDWFEGMQVLNTSCGNTTLRGTLADKSAVYGVLSRLSSLGITITSLTCQEELDLGPP